MSRETDLLRAVHVAGVEYDKAYKAWYKAEYTLDEATNAEANAVMALVAYYEEVD